MRKVRPEVRSPTGERADVVRAGKAYSLARRNNTARTRVHRNPWPDNTHF